MLRCLHLLEHKLRVFVASGLTEVGTALFALGLRFLRTEEAVELLSGDALTLVGEQYGLARERDRQFRKRILQAIGGE